MEQFAEVIKVFIEKHLIPSIISIVAAIVTYLFLPQDNWIILKLGKSLFIVLVFCLCFLLVQTLVKIRDMIRNTAHNIHTNDYFRKVAEKNSKQAIRDINDYFDQLSPQDKAILLEFVKNRNKIMITGIRYDSSDGLLQNLNVINVSDYVGDIHIIDKQRYWLSPDLKKLLKSQAKPAIRLKQYRIKDEIFHDFKLVYEATGKLGNF